MILSIVIPVFNEEKTIEEALGRVVAAKLPKNWRKEVIVVDDSSTDRTLGKIKEEEQKIIKQKIKFKIFENKKNCGKGFSVRRGMKEATGDVLVIQDADLEYNPQDFSRLLAPIIAQKAKVVYGSRLKTLKFRLWGKNKTPLPLHYLMNRFLSWLTNLLYRSSLSDMETCYKMITKEVYKKLDLVSDRFEIEPEITAKILNLGYQIEEIPIETKPRGYQEGKKIKAKDAFLAIHTLLKFKFFPFWPLFFLISLVLFWPSLRAYFSQDDFFHLRASQADSVSGFLNFFSFSSVRGYAFYRPVSREVFNFTMGRIFGLNPLPFHLIQFVIFGLNLYLLESLLNHLFPKQTKLRLTTLFLYATSAIHLGTFYYLSSFQLLACTSFVLLSLISFQRKKNAASFAFFVLALLSHELGYLTPVLLLALEKKFPVKKSLKIIGLFFLISLILGYLNVNLVKLPQQETYIPSFSLKKISNSLAWYVFWGLGIPEHMFDFVGPGFKINPKIINGYPFYFWTMVISFVFLIIFLAVKVIEAFSDQRFCQLVKESLFPIIWFLATISIFLLLPSHRFVYYLILAQIGISLILAVILAKKFNLISGLVVVSYLILNLNTIKWGEKTYWPLNRSRLAQQLSGQIKAAYPSLPPGATLYLKNDPGFFSPGQDWGGTAKQAYLALSGSDGIQLLYQDTTLKVVYENGPQLSSADQVFEFVAKPF